MNVISLISFIYFYFIYFIFILYFFCWIDQSVCSGDAQGAAGGQRSSLISLHFNESTQFYLSLWKLIYSDFTEEEFIQMFGWTPLSSIRNGEAEVFWRWSFENLHLNEQFQIQFSKNSSWGNIIIITVSLKSLWASVVLQIVYVVSASGENKLCPNRGKKNCCLFWRNDVTTWFGLKTRN